MKRPRISVITIYLNAEPFLEEAVASVQLQTGAEWELLLVDDGSTDGSTALGRRLAEESGGRIRYLHHLGHRNRGMSAARNLGLRHAQGEYIGFLDSDDVLLPGALQESSAVLEANADTAMVFGRTVYWYSWSGREDDRARDHADREAVPGRSTEPVPPPGMLLRFLEAGAAPCMCSILVKREVARRVGGFETRFRGLYEDQAFLAKLALRHAMIERDEIWGMYRQHDASACRVAAMSHSVPAARRRFLLWLDRYIRRHRLDSPAVAACMERVLAPFREPADARRRWAGFRRRRDRPPG